MKSIEEILLITDLENKKKANELTDMYAILYHISKVENRTQIIIELEEEFNSKRRNLEREIYGEVIYP